MIDGRGDAHRGLAAFVVENRAGVGARPDRDFLLAVVGNSRLFIVKQPSIYGETAVYSSRKSRLCIGQSHLFMEKEPSFREKEPSIHGSEPLIDRHEPFLKRDAPFTDGDSKSI